MTDHSQQFIVGHMTNEQFVEQSAKGPDSFAEAGTHRRNRRRTRRRGL